MSWYRQWRPYVPVARRRAQAQSYAARLAKKRGAALAPVTIAGRTIVTTFWGKAWCDNLERYSDFENRMPRGRTYVRNGSVIDLKIERGSVNAIVSGSEVYQVQVEIKMLPEAAWKRIRNDCARSIDSLLDLWGGRFGEGVMQRLTHPTEGLFPQPGEIKMRCSCPDWAVLCKHVAAVLYGVGARLDSSPELLFTLRDVDHLELVAEATAAANIDRALDAAADAQLAGDLGELFGIELDGEPQPAKRSRRKRLDAAAVSTAAPVPPGARRKRRPAKPVEAAQAAPIEPRRPAPTRARGATSKSR
jgi:uncharacterized Zn finger protein